MKEHGLSQWSNLITSQFTPDANSPLSLDVEKLADRFFASGLATPERVFTGYNFDYASRYDDGYWRFNNWPQLGGRQDVYELEHLKGALDQPEKLVDISDIWGCSRKSDQMSYAHLVLGGHLWELSDSFNLLSDLLVSPSRRDIGFFSVDSPSITTDIDESAAKNKEGDWLVCNLFRREIEAESSGWVEVIPYNNHLVFLKGVEGHYDFVLRGIKKEKFNHQIYAPYLKPSDLPRQMNDLYDFQRWYYFEYKGWHEQDTHQAVMHYHSNGGEAPSYPGEWGIWKTYFSYLGMYNYKPVKANSTMTSPFDFKLVEVNGKKLNVSQLISIDDIKRFSNQCSEYFEQRIGIQGQKPDVLESMNSDGGDLPAAVTWFDACAFLSHIETTYQLPVRLLKLEEFRSIRKACPDDNKAPTGSLLEFLDLQGNSYGAQPHYMEEADFQALLCKYTHELKYLEHKSGLKFVDSDQFCEWLFENPCGMEALAISSKSLKSARGSFNVERDLFPAWSTGKYHHCKIGFRICFESV